MTNEPARKEEEFNGQQSVEDQWGEALSEQNAQEQKATETEASGAEQTNAAKQAAPEAGQTQEKPEAKTDAKPRVVSVSKSPARPASFNALSDESAGKVGNMDMVLDIPVTISVEIGRTRMMIKDLLQLGQGTVVELEKLAGEPMEILVNGRLIARGEAVVINEKFGIKLTDIVSPTERINNLR